MLTVNKCLRILQGRVNKFSLAKNQHQVGPTKWYVLLQFLADRSQFQLTGQGRHIWSTGSQTTNLNSHNDRADGLLLLLETKVKPSQRSIHPSSCRMETLRLHWLPQMVTQQTSLFGRMTASNWNPHGLRINLIWTSRSQLLCSPTVPCWSLPSLQQVNCLCLNNTLVQAYGRIIPSLNQAVLTMNTAWTSMAVRIRF